MKDYILLIAVFLVGTIVGIVSTLSVDIVDTGTYIVVNRQQDQVSCSIMTLDVDPPEGIVTDAC